MTHFSLLASYKKSEFGVFSIRPSTASELEIKFPYWLKEHMKPAMANISLKKQKQKQYILCNSSRFILH